MIALKLTDTKTFMSHLLLTDTFDQFLFIEGEIVTFSKFTIDGYTQKEFYSLDKDEPDKLEDYARWKKIKDFCFSVIRGKRTPLSFKLIFRLSPENTKKLIEQNTLDFQPSNVQGLYLNIRFDGTILQCVTGTSLKTFSLDKSLEHAWDNMVQKYFDRKGLSFEIEI